LAAVAGGYTRRQAAAAAHLIQGDHTAAPPVMNCTGIIRADEIYGSNKTLAKIKEGK
jgi:hypothetical protein